MLAKHYEIMRKFSGLNSHILKILIIQNRLSTEKAFQLMMKQLKKSSWNLAWKDNNF